MCSNTYKPISFYHLPLLLFFSILHKFARHVEHTARWLRFFQLCIAITLWANYSRHSAVSNVVILINNMWRKYEKIDILWNTIESCLRHLQERDAKSKLLRSRSAMEYALHKHFQLMKVSEQGMLSARALQGRWIRNCRNYSFTRVFIINTGNRFQ